MEPTGWSPRLHVLVCTNHRTAGDMPSCAPNGGEQVLAALRAAARRRRLGPEVQIGAAGCLGWCHAEGVTVAVWPAGVFYRRVGVADCDALLARHLVSPSP